MRLLFFDSLFPAGHIQLNCRYIDIMRKMKVQVDVLGPSGWFENEQTKYRQLSWYTDKECTGNHFTSRVRSFMNCIKILKIKELNKYDIVYFASFDIIVFLFFFLVARYRCNRIILQHHNNVDQLDNTIKRFLFGFYANHVDHFAFERFICSRLRHTGVLRNRIHCIPHPVPNYIKNGVVDKGLIVALSNSNSEIEIEKIVNCQKYERLFDETNFNLLVKSRTMEYADEHLRLINKWINNEEYQKYESRAEFFLLFFPTDKYKYRVSNFFLEAVALEKKIIANRFPLAEFYNNVYPGICTIVDQAKEIKNAIEEYEIANRSAIESFIEEHSEDSINQAFSLAFNSILNRMP